jgi:hypothetical protein
MFSAPQAPTQPWDWRYAPKKSLNLLALLAAWREHSSLGGGMPELPGLVSNLSP